jgi:hypothetical protein
MLFCYGNTLAKFHGRVRIGFIVFERTIFFLQRKLNLLRQLD